MKAFVPGNLYYMRLKQDLYIFIVDCPVESGNQFWPQILAKISPRPSNLRLIENCITQQYKLFAKDLREGDALTDLNDDLFRLWGSLEKTLRWLAEVKMRTLISAEFYERLCLLATDYYGGRPCLARKL